MKEFFKYLAGGVVVVIAFAVGSFFHSVAPQQDNLSGLVELENKIFKSGITVTGMGEAWKELDIPTGNVTSAYTGGFRPSDVIGSDLTAYVDKIIFVRTGTASTTLALDVPTSTAATLAYNAAPYSSGIDSKLIVTSTPDTIVINNFEDQGTNGTQIFAVNYDEYVNYLISDPYNPASCTGALCENATSTARGWTAKMFVHFYWKSPRS